MLATSLAKAGLILSHRREAFQRASNGSSHTATAAIDSP